MFKIKQLMYCWYCRIFC